MKKVNLIPSLLAAISATILSGCSWHGVLGRDFYNPPSQFNYQRQITVALMSATPPDNVRYGMSVDYQLDIKNYIYALQKEMALYFRDVRVVNSASQCPECDLFAFSRLSVSLNQTLNTYGGRLDIEFYDKAKTRVTNLSSLTSGNAAPSAGLQTLSTVNSALLFSLAPTTIDQYGQFITAVTAKAIAEMTADIGTKMKYDKSLLIHEIAIDPPKSLRPLKKKESIKDLEI